MQSLISLTFDDGLRCQFEQALPILNQYGLPATFFLVANTDPILKDGCRHPDWSKTDWGEKDIRFLKSMVQRGHEVGAHSVHHRQRVLDKNPKLETEDSKKWIEDRMGIEISSYSYPFSHFTDPIRKAVIDAGYKQARWGANAVYYPLQDPIDHFKVDCRHISKSDYELVGGNVVGKYGAENVGGWLRPGCWHVLMFHGIGTVNDGWWAIPVAEFARQMAELAEHRDAGAVEVVTFKEGAQMISSGRSSVKSGVPRPTGNRMSITAIVCTYNRCQSLSKALDALAASTFPNSIEWEVLVVDNNSCDQTRKVAESFCLQDPAHFSYLFEPHQGLSYARNAGIRKARGEILAFTDDDDQVEPGWLWNLTSALQGREWLGAGGPIIPVWPRRLPKWLSTDDPATMGSFGEFYPGAEAGPLTRPPYGGNMAFRREAFEKYGGFRVDLGRSGSNLQGREDIEFANRLLAGGERLWYEARAVVRAFVPECRMEKSYVLRWWYWYGRSEVVESGPPSDATCHLLGAPLSMFRRLFRWALQSMISIGAARRFSSQRNMCYIAGTIVACYQWARQPKVRADVVGEITGTRSEGEPVQASTPR